MIRLLSIVIATAFALTACGGAQKTATATADSGAATLPDSAICPVSGKKFKPTATTKTAVYKGKTYYLCCPGCAKKFAADPAKFTAPKAPKGDEAAAGAKMGDMHKMGHGKKPCKGDCPDHAKKEGAHGKKPCGKDCKGDCPDCANKATTVKTAGELGLTLPETAVCPVSGKTFKPTAATKVVTHGGKHYYMCCPGCAGKFTADPGKFLTAAK